MVSQGASYFLQIPKDFSYALWRVRLWVFLVLWIFLNLALFLRQTFYCIAMQIDKHRGSVSAFIFLLGAKLYLHSHTQKQMF